MSLGTFHQGLSELHGITIVVDTAGSRLYVGRCHEADGRSVVLHDADVFDETPEVSKAAYLTRAAEWGVFKKHDVLVVPAAEVASIRRLGEI